jgi:uncharacterized membrane protein
MNALLARRLTLLSYAGLVLIVVLWYFLVDPPRFFTSTLLSVLYLGILLIPAYGLIKRRPRIYLWSSYLILIYFTHAVVESYANTEHRGFAIAELLLSIVYFVNASLCVRYERQGLL